MLRYLAKLHFPVFSKLENTSQLNMGKSDYMIFPTPWNFLANHPHFFPCFPVSCWYLGQSCKTGFEDGDTPHGCIERMPPTLASRYWTLYKQEISIWLCHWDVGYLSVPANTPKWVLIYCFFLIFGSFFLYGFEISPYNPSIIPRLALSCLSGSLIK